MISRMPATRFEFAMRAGRDRAMDDWDQMPSRSSDPLKLGHYLQLGVYSAFLQAFACPSLK